MHRLIAALFEFLILRSATRGLLIRLYVLKLKAFILRRRLREHARRLVTRPPSVRAQISMAMLSARVAIMNHRQRRNWIRAQREARRRIKQTRQRYGLRGTAYAMATGTSSLPQLADVFTVLTDGVSVDAAANLNHLQDAVSALETYAGVGPVLYNVKGNAFNGVADGSTLTAVPIQNAITAASNAGGGIVFLSAGDWYCGTTALSVPAGVFVLGAGMVVTKLTFSSAITVDAMVYSGASGVPSGAGGFEIRASGGTSAHDALVASNANFVIFDHAWVDSGFTNGMKWTGAGDCQAMFCQVEGVQQYGYYVTQSDPIQVWSSKSYQNGYGFVASTPRSPGGAGSHTYACAFENCVDTESTSAGFYINGYTDVKIAEPIVQTKGAALQQPTKGIWIDNGALRIDITGPKVVHAKQYGIHVLGNSGPVTISNPSIEAIGSFSAVPAVSIYGIRVDTGSTASISGGSVTNIQGDGISHWGSGVIQGTSVTDASLANSGTNGLIAVEVAPAAGAVIIVSGVIGLNNSGPRGTGFRVSTATGVVQFDHCSATGYSNAYDNNGGAGITRSVWQCSWANSNIPDGLGVWGHAAPTSQPAAPVTLADVIAIIRGCGLSA